MKNVWFITHDNHIDRRIFFFSDFFEARGCTITLFPGHNLEGTGEPAFIKRPVEKKILKDYACEPPTFPQYFADALTAINELQQEYWAAHARFANNLNQLGFLTTDNRIRRIEMIVSDFYYSLHISDADHTALWNNITNISTLAHCDNNNFTWLIEKTAPIEAVLLEILTKDSFGTGHTTYGEITVCEYYDKSGEKIIHCRHVAGEYEYHTNSRQLFELEPFACDYTPVDSLAGTQIHASAFKNTIYNYTPILESVKRSADVPPDLVYVADLPTLPIGLLLKKAFGCKLIVDCHEWWMRQSQLWEPDRTHKIKLIDEYEKDYYPQADLRITVGDRLAQKMSDYFSVPFQTIYSCVNAGLMPAQPDPGFFARFGLTSEHKVAIFQGSLTTLRNLDNLARATKYLDPLHYLVICGGGCYENAFRRILKAEGNEAQVIFAGWIPQNELMNYTINADLGLLPYVAIDDYFALSMPNKIMEFFNASLPVLLDSSLLELSDIVLKNKVGRAVDCSNPAAFGMAMNSLLSDQKSLAAMKENYAQCGELFTQHAQNTRFESILRDAGIV